MSADRADPGFGIYIHWPFCLAKCPYCDFNSHVSREVDQDAWANNLCTELKHMSGLQDRRTVTSIFFGGGTPSLMEGRTVARLIDAVAAHYDIDPGVEISLEANPTSVEAARFDAYAKAGVNRVSIGVQALNNKDLKDLGRLHSVSEALGALETARRRFARVSFDLIYARSGQTLEDWERELGEALAFKPDHLSLYQLTIEPGTPFAALAAKGALDLPSEDRAADMYELTNRQCREHGLEGYEISNYAKPGAESRHNLTYWRYGDYIGVGPGAHGRLTSDGRKWATYCASDPKAWSAAVESDGHGLELHEEVSQRQQVEERLLMGLRLQGGVGLSGLDIDLAVARELAADGFVTLSADRLAATDKGRPVLNRLIAELVSA